MTALYIILALTLALRAGAGTLAWQVRRGDGPGLRVRWRPQFDRSVIPTTLVLLTSEVVLTLAASLVLAGVWSAVMIAP
jgi:hypothetical protein